MNRPPQARAAGGLLAGLARAAVAGTLLAVVAASCSDTRTSDQRRRDERVTETRRGVRAPGEGDTASLVTPIRGDSLIGAARGAGGVATLQSECMACHPAVHDAVLGSDSSVSKVCASCHQAVHEPIQAFYAGAVSGMPVPPDTMFVARVACAGCHADSTFRVAAGAARLGAMDALCTSCHGERFTGMLAGWREGLAWRAQAVASYVGRASADPRLGREPARTRVQAAREALDLLRAAGPLHNVLGADKLFRSAVDSAAAAYRQAGIAAPVRPALGPDPERTACLGCHYGVEGARTTIFGETFDHATHVVRADVACAECHSDATYFVAAQGEDAGADRDVDPRHGRTTITARSCDNCHHAPTSELACTTCHSDDARLGQPLRVTMALDLRPENAPPSRPVSFSHTVHAKTACASCHARGDVRSTASCASCHQDHHRAQVANCTSCHGTGNRAEHTRNDHVRCTSCHLRETVAMLLPNRAFCVSCHVAQVDHKPEGECTTCHMQTSPGALKARILAATR